MTAPCKDCPKKGCGSYHSECEKYKEYQREKTEWNDKLIEYKKTSFTRAKLKDMGYHYKKREGLR